MEVLSIKSLSSSPDSSRRAAAQSMNGQDQTRQETTFLAGRKRVARACDKCSKSRTRCNGSLPWSVVSSRGIDQVHTRVANVVCVKSSASLAQVRFQNRYQMFMASNISLQIMDSVVAMTENRNRGDGCLQSA
jgi:hypothetical protein